MDKSVTKDPYQEGRSRTGRPVETVAKPAPEVREPVKEDVREEVKETPSETPSETRDLNEPVVEVGEFKSHQMTAVKINAAILLGVIFYYFLKYTFRF